MNAVSETLSEQALERNLREAQVAGQRIALHPTLLDVDPSEITDEQAERLVFAAINGLFAGYEIGAATHERVRKDHEGISHGYVYRTLVNGAWRPEGGSCVYPETIGEAVCNSVKAVAEAWPDHAKLQVVWRHLPVLERDEAHDDIIRSGEVIIPAAPARWQLYMRLVAAPVV